MQNNNEEKIDFKKKLAEWKVTVKTRWWILLVELAVIGVILLVDLLTKKYAWEYLNTYGYNVAPGAKSMEALNYYTDEVIAIPLDPLLSASENAKKYFDKYGKLHLPYIQA